MIKPNEIQNNYERFDDTRIKLIAKNDAKGLRDETVPILIEEIKKRNLDIELIDWIFAERRKLSVHEWKILKRKVSECTCNSCNKGNQLKGYKFRTQIGIVIGNLVGDYELIICKKCGRKRRRNSAIWTFLFGWWSPAGLISTPFLLFEKIISTIQEEKQSEQIVESFIESNIGRITLGKDSQDVIQTLLKEFNDKIIENDI